MSAEFLEIVNDVAFKKIVGIEKTASSKHVVLSKGHLIIFDTNCSVNVE